jgi:hypothetical protein
VDAAAGLGATAAGVVAGKELIFAAPHFYFRAAMNCASANFLRFSCLYKKLKSMSVSGSDSEAQSFMSHRRPTNGANGGERSSAGS